MQTPASPNPAPSETPSSRSISPQDLLNDAQRNRLSGQWSIAERQYQILLEACSTSAAPAVLAALHHNRCICLYALKRHEEALAAADSAFALDPSLWQSGLIAASCSKVLEPVARYVERVLQLNELHGAQPQVQVLHAQVLMNQLGDAVGARRRAEPLVEHPAQGREASLLCLMSRLYDRDESDSPRRITQDIVVFSATHLTLDDADVQGLQDIALPMLPPRQPGRRRIGIVSNLLQSSPVHALTMKTLRQWQEDGADLFFFQRGVKTDWATEEFRSVASGWLDVCGLDALRLHNILRCADLDVLYEMGGWMDAEALKAVSVKPCPEMYKWVGGQSCTTGLRSFDGFISDAEQSPAGSESFYTEPLVRVTGSYVSYSPPPYLKDLENVAAGQNNGVWGVISNPVKLSRSFLAWLAAAGRGEVSFRSHRQQADVAVGRLVLADYRYALPAVRARIEQVLRPAWGDRLVIETPEGHRGFIELLASLQGLVDTFPYSCGLTMVEGLHVGLDICFPPAERVLFCERHGLAHVLHHDNKTTK